LSRFVFVLFFLFFFSPAFFLFPTLFPTFRPKYFTHIFIIFCYTIPISLRNYFFFAISRMLPNNLSTSLYDSDSESEAESEANQTRLDMNVDFDKNRQQQPTMPTYEQRLLALGVIPPAVATHTTTTAIPPPPMAMQQPPPNSPTILPTADVEMAKESSDEWESDSEDEDVEMDNGDGALPTRQTNLTYIPAIPECYKAEYPAVDLQAMLYHIPEKLAMVGFTELVAGHRTVFRDERGEYKNQVIVTAPCKMTSRWTFLTMLVFQPNTLTHAPFPAFDTSITTASRTNLHGGIIVNTERFFDKNNSFTLAKKKHEKKKEIGFPLSKNFAESGGDEPQFVLCLIPLEKGKFMLDKAIRTQPFFGKTKRTDKILGKTTTAATKKEIKVLQTDINSADQIIKSLKEQLCPLKIKVNKINQNFAKIRTTLQRRGTDDALCIGLRYFSKAIRDQEEEEFSL
jgi:hypothetical protein